MRLFSLGLSSTHPWHPLEPRDTWLFTGKVLCALLTVDKIKCESTIKLSLHLEQAACNLSVISTCLIFNSKRSKMLPAAAENTTIFTRL